MNVRVWDNEEKIMINHNDLIALDQESMCIYSLLTERHILKEIAWIPLLYTGMKDTNGRKIYEGDILTYNKQEYVAGYPKETNPVERVTHGSGAFWVGDDLLADAIYNDSENKVIGNIFENPELLEQAT